MLLSLIHQSIVQQQATPGDLLVATVKTEPVSPAQIALEQSEDKPKHETESSLIPPALSNLLASDLVEATEAGSSTLTNGLISMPDFRFLEVVPLKTPFLKIASIVATLAIP